MKDVRVRMCREVLELIDRLCKDRNRLALLCGGLHECYQIYEQNIEYMYGVNYLGDDIYEIKAMKRLGKYIAGRWVEHEIGGYRLCIGGIDALNHRQNLERLLKSIPSSCDLYIVLSAYPPKESRCSRVVVSRYSFRVGIPNLTKILEENLPSKTVIVSCHRAIDTLCIDRVTDRVVHVALSRNPLHLLRIPLDEEGLEIHVEELTPRYAQEVR